LTEINSSLAPFIHFLAHIEAMTGIRRETRPRGRPRKEAADPQTANDSDQGKLGI